ncbi:MAG: FliG C-terminal domain-containing protein [Myxococcota bacterium]
MPTLTEPEKAAIFVLSLEKPVARSVLRHFGDADLRRLTEAAEKLPHVEQGALDEACEEFIRTMRSPITAGGQGEYVRKLVTAAVGETRARDVFDPGPVCPPAMEALRAAHAPTLAELLVDEHPQIAAVVLSQLPEPKAAQVLAVLPEEQQSDLITRLLEIEEVPMQQVELVSEALAQALEAAGGVAELDARAEFDAVRFAATILNEMPSDASEHILEELDAIEDSELGTRVREAMFTFEDLARLGVRDLQLLMRDIDNETLLISLKTANEELRAKLLAGVSARAAKQILEELPMLPPTKLSDVERAQREAVEVAMRLSEAGKLVLPGGSGEEMV